MASDRATVAQTHRAGWPNGRPRRWSLCAILNAIFYVTRGGISWRMLSDSFPPWRTVYTYFWLWTRSGLWAQINAALVRRVRQRHGRQSGLAALVRAYQGRVLQRGKGRRHCRLSTIWADGAYEDIVAWVKLMLGWTLQIVRRPPEAKGWVVLPKR